MNCKDTNRQMMAFLEGSLPEKERLPVSNHLKECSSCKEFSLFLEKSLSQIDVETDVREDEQFIDEIFRKIDSGSKQSFGIRKLIPLLAAASVILFAVFTGINIAKYTSDINMLDRNSANNDILFASEISREPIENYFLINDNEKE